MIHERGLHAIPIDPGRGARRWHRRRCDAAGNTPSATSGRSRPSRTPTSCIRRASSRRPPPLRGALQRNPDFGFPISSWGIATTTCTSPPKKGEPENDGYLPKRWKTTSKPSKNRGHDPQGGADPKALIRVPDCGLWTDKLNDLDKADPRQGAHRLRAERADQLPGARQALRGRGTLRRGRGQFQKADGSQAERRHGLPVARRVLQPAGELRQDDGSWDQRADGAEQPGSLAHHWGRPTGKVLMRDKKLHHGQAEGIRRQRHRSRGQGPGAQHGVLRSGHLQEHPAAPPGEHREGSGQAEELLAKADELRNKALEIQKKQNGGAAAPKAGAASKLAGSGAAPTGLWAVAFGRRPFS